MKLAFAREARNDLVRLRAFIAVHDPAAAARAARRLIRGIERLMRFPRLGRRVNIGPGEVAPDEIRDWPVGDYVVRYLIAGDRVIVLRVWHGRERRG
ncbi:MAG: type II toxin-antitoxin system RelE/ParE family toxin [Hydrogenophilaceae bacterium]|nr:type II toxin-antitoxin system RelE/ParE family toxin [Hydrogenophilaceae bacterium]